MVSQWSNERGDEQDFLGPVDRGRGNSGGKSASGRLAASNYWPNGTVLGDVSPKPRNPTEPLCIPSSYDVKKRRGYSFEGNPRFHLQRKKNTAIGLRNCTIDKSRFAKKGSDSNYFQRSTPYDVKNKYSLVFNIKV